MEGETTFWLLSLPLEGRLSRGKDGIDQVVQVVKDKASDMATTHKFTLPELRVGTLDSLLTLSDELVKTSTLVEAVTSKIRRQLGELGHGELRELSVDGVPVRRYMSGFAWNEAKHPARRPLRETAEKLAEGVARLEEELKVKASEYNGVKQTLGALTRKAGGTLSTRDLSDLVAKASQAKLLVESEHMTTLLVVVPQHSAKDWRSSYESLAQLVVPRSSKLVAEEGDFCLFTVVVFKKFAEAFKGACREKSFQVRDFVNDPGASAENSAEAGRLTAELASRKANLEEWCRSAFGEAFAAMMHVAAVRLFVESILRYGLPPCFATVLCAPDKKHEKRMRTLLASAFGRNASAHWKQREDDAAKGEEVHPYVSITLAMP